MKYALRKRILSVPSARTTRSWMKKITFKRFGDLSLYKFAKIFLHNIHEDEIFDRANSVAYNFILAIFPTIIFLFTLIPYVTVYFPEITNESIMSFIGEQLPPSMADVISSTVLDIVSNQRGGLLTFGFFFALYLATNGMVALMRAFNACYRTVDRRNFLRTRLTAAGLTVMLSIVLFMAILLLVVGQIVINYFTSHVHALAELSLDKLSLYFILLLRFLVIFIVFFIAISCIYYFGPAVHYNWSFFSIGSLLATLACLGISYGFSYYVANFGSYNKVYGSIGTLIAMMIWVQLLTMVLLFGYEVNASLHYATKVEAISAQKAKMKRKEKASR
ncbi:MAG TPA: YihY/virulence factor BrkB family protein [Cyclobacteriaceae bacterium]|nr:YihY/virulence factor BrkB family protein [Cyclobacteriaceae bacterium]